MNQSDSWIRGAGAVFFDLVGTLIRARRPIGEQYAAVARRHGAGQADALGLEQAFRQEFRAAGAIPVQAGSAADIARAEREWWVGLVRRIIARAGLGDDLGGRRFDAFFDELYRHFTTADAWSAYPDAGPALERVRARGLRVGLVTNYDTRVYAVLNALGLSSALDSVTIPAVAGAAKPDRRIFAKALGTHGLPADAVVHVGDSMVDDYEGASAAGLVAILLDRPDAHGAASIRRIVSLDEL